MDNPKIWFYIILGGIYLLSRILKKSDQPPTPDTHKKPSENAESPTSKPMTFEELMREISASKNVPQSQKPITSVPQTTYVDYDDQIEDEVKDLEDVNYQYRSKGDVYDTYEEAKKKAFNQSSLEDTLKLENTNMEYGKFKEFDQKYQPTLLDKYIEDLKDPEGFKKAIVLNEILNRKF